MGPFVSSLVLLLLALFSFALANDDDRLNPHLYYDTLQYENGPFRHCGTVETMSKFVYESNWCRRCPEDTEPMQEISDSLFSQWLHTCCSTHCTPSLIMQDCCLAVTTTTTTTTTTPAPTTPPEPLNPAEYYAAVRAEDSVFRICGEQNFRRFLLESEWCTTCPEGTRQENLAGADYRDFGEKCCSFCRPSDITQYCCEEPPVTTTTTTQPTTTLPPLNPASFYAALREKDTIFRQECGSMARLVVESGWCDSCPGGKRPIELGREDYERLDKECCDDFCRPSTIFWLCCRPDGDDWLTEWMNPSTTTTTTEATTTKAPPRLHEKEFYRALLRNNGRFQLCNQNQRRFIEEAVVEWCTDPNDHACPKGESPAPMINSDFSAVHDKCCYSHCSPEDIFTYCCDSPPPYR